MKSFAFINLLLLLSFHVYTQERGEMVTITSQFTRVELIRMSPGADMLEGLKKAVIEKGIRNGVILSGIGSVTDYHFHVVSDKNLPPGEEDPEASMPKDLIAVQGYILDNDVHAHITLSDENSVIGGHLEPGTKALTFFIITIGVLPDSLEIGDLDYYGRQ
jgi:predicted DNA-binding protein with PD1-like motif